MTSNVNSPDLSRPCRALIEQLLERRVSSHAADTGDCYAVTTPFGAFRMMYDGTVLGFWEPNKEECHVVSVQASPEELQEIKRLAERDDERRKKQGLMKLYALHGEHAFFLLGSEEAVELREMLNRASEQEVH